MRYEVHEGVSEPGANYALRYRIYDNVKKRYMVNSYSTKTEAQDIADKANASINQLRKYTNEPYINHPCNAVAIVKSVPHIEEMVAAAWLHDVVEDNPITLLLLGRVFTRMSSI